MDFDLTPEGQPSVEAVCVRCWELTRLPWSSDVPQWTEADYAEHADEVERRFGPSLDAMLLSAITDSAHRVWPPQSGS